LTKNQVEIESVGSVTLMVIL